LKFEGRIGIDNYSSVQLATRYYDVDYPQGFFRNYNNHTTEINADFIAYFDKRFSDFHVTALAGANYRDYDFGYTYVGAENLTIPGLYTPSNALGSPTAYQDNQRQRSNSVYGNLSVGWKNQLYVDMTARNDWDSTIKDDFFYPSVSGSWIPTETFAALHGNPTLNFLKLRGTWAKVGSGTVPYRSGSYFGSNTYSMKGVMLNYLPQVAPPLNLLPEMITTWEVGLEAYLFNNRLHIDAAYYERKTTNQIMQANISPATGYSAMVLNAGKISNKGVEVQISGDIIKTRDFTWTATLNWAKDKSRVDELYTDPVTGQVVDVYQLGSSWSVVNQALVGRSWGTLVGTGYVYNEDGSIQTASGMPVYKSSQNIGDVTPDWLAGFHNEFRYKNLSFSFLLDYRRGGDLYSLSQAFGSQTGIYEYTAAGDIRENGAIAGQNVLTDKVFKNADGTVNTTPVNAESFFYNFYRICEMAVIDGSYLKLRELNLTYTFPKSLLNKTKVISGARISLIGSNVAMLWTHKSNLINLDPESTTGTAVSNVGFESNTYPPARSIGLKLGLTF
jgi:outer membrane receptor protein involved in Fe transport